MATPPLFFFFFENSKSTYLPSSHSVLFPLTVGGPLPTQATSSASACSLKHTPPGFPCAAPYALPFRWASHWVQVCSGSPV